jgi:Pyruvate/2-oxoacid:ferredoxin oxidoreductase delta subunit
MAVFSGTGNTLLMAVALVYVLKIAVMDTTLLSMERTDRFELQPGVVLGLAVPVACFSTYPTAWRFIDSLPDGAGREVFFLATMGGYSGGMAGPLRKALKAKGYEPIGSLIVKMPGNYGNKTIDVKANKIKEEKARALVRKFASDLLEDRASWPKERAVLSGLFASLAHGRKPWSLFYRLFPIHVDPDKCSACALCARLCPEKNIKIDDKTGKAAIGGECQCCQRCVAFCENGAIYVPGKPAVQYQGIGIESIMSLSSGRSGDDFLMAGRR